MEEVLLYGFGGHGKVVAELLLESGVKWIGVFDDNSINSSNKSIEYLGTYNSQIHIDKPLIITVGDNNSRKAISEKIKHSYFTFIHKSAYVAPNVKIDEGTIVMQNAIIQTNVVVGKHCIVNINSSIDHDSTISDFVHITPHAYIGSNSFISSIKDLNPGQIIPRFTNF